MSRVVRAIALSLALLAGAAGARAAGTPGSEDAALTARIAAIASRLHARVGVSVVHVESGRHAGVREDEPRVMQSTFKLPLAVAVLDAVDRGAFTLDTPIPLRARDMNSSASALTDRWPEGGATVSVHDLLAGMLETSDNTAADVLLRITGGPAAVNATLRREGIDAMRVDRGEWVLGNDWYGFAPAATDTPMTAAALKAARAAVPPARRTAADRAFRADPRDHASPEAFTGLLAKLETRRLLSPASRETLLAIMSRCRTGGNRLRAGLPAQVKVADRTGTGGTWRGTTNAVNAVGLLTLPGSGGHVAIAVLISDLRGPVPAAEKAIAAIARATFEEWNAPE